jgi:coenzyme F420-reducing hydrogenase alpha subunit
MTDGRRRTINVDYLARVEGEGALTIVLEGGRAKEVRLRIFEPPRFFEAFLRGRGALEAPDITSRICGICPMAYITSACNAVEAAFGIALEPGHRALRRLMYCGEWVESHALHVFMLHAPDFLGYPDALAMAKEHPDLVRTGLRIKKAGNSIVALIGGREVHPVNVRVGGFYRAPTRAELASLAPELTWAREAARETVARLAAFSFPQLERDYDFVALRDPSGRYPIENGRVVSTSGLDLAADEYPAHFVEEQVPYSTALHSRRIGGGAYVCGPLARFNSNAERLSPVALEAARAAGLAPPVRNPFKGLLVRAIEIVYALDEALRIIGEYAPPSRPFVDAPPRAAVGHGVSEAPRGLLYHRYAIDEAGTIREARIVPPTSQNQRSIEEDLAELAPVLASLPHADATWRAEQAVRNYDPCISCSTHFLRLRIEGA